MPHVAERTSFAGSDRGRDVGWYSRNSDFQTHPVKGLEPNGCGFYDLTGNVHEWTQDWWGDFPEVATDPIGVESSVYRVSRGGSWWGGGKHARVAHRHRNEELVPKDHVGMRVGRTALGAIEW